MKHVVLTEFLAKILKERAVVCRECFLFYYNFRIGEIFFIFAYIIYIYIYIFIAFAYIIIYSVIYSTNTILTITKLINTSNKVRWDVKDKLACYGTKELSEKKKL